MVILDFMSGTHLELLQMAATYYKEFDLKDIFEVFEVLAHFWWRGAMTIEDPLLSDHGYQLLSIATSYLVGNNRKFDVSDIFWGVLFIVGGD